MVVSLCAQNWFCRRRLCFSPSAPSTSLIMNRFVPFIPEASATSSRFMYAPLNELCSMKPMMVSE